MSATYDPSLSTPKDQVRLRLGDRTDPFYLQDEEINAMLGQYSYDEACAQLAEGLGTYFAQQATMFQQRNRKLQYTDRAQFYMNLAKEIRANAQPLPGDPIATGAVPSVVCHDLCDYNHLMHQKDGRFDA